MQFDVGSAYHYGWSNIRVRSEMNRTGRLKNARVENVCFRQILTAV